MKQFNTRKLRFTPIVAVAILAAIAGLSSTGGCASGPRRQVATPSALPATTAAPPSSHSLTGAELYAINCNRCHPERSPIERRSTEWKTILTHMRVRANLPAAQARLILQYLQDNSGS